MKYYKDDLFYYYEIVKLNIKKYKMMANLTQHQLAELTDISQKYLFQNMIDKYYFILTVIGKVKLINCYNFIPKKVFYLIFSF